MALKSTVFKVTLNVSDLDRNHYGAYTLTLARHPSENDQRLMIRLLAFALFADEKLAFGRGLSSEGEPALWQHGDRGDIERWIEVGLPDEKALRKAAGRSRAVVVVAYGGRAIDVWWQREQAALAKLTGLTVLAVGDDECAALAALAARVMDLQCTISEGHVWLAGGDTTVEIVPRRLKAAG